MSVIDDLLKISNFLPSNTYSKYVIFSFLKEKKLIQLTEIVYKWEIKSDPHSVFGRLLQVYPENSPRSTCHFLQPPLGACGSSGRLF